MSVQQLDTICDTLIDLSIAEHIVNHQETCLTHRVYTGGLQDDRVAAVALQSLSLSLSSSVAVHPFSHLGTRLTARAMELRSGIYKGVHGVLPAQQRAQFEEGVNLLFSSWTALCLAIDNEWGGPSSRQKAEQLYQDVLHWFYSHTEHYADDLEVDLEAAMMQDFNTELQDDSPRQVSLTLVSLHQECLQGNHNRIQQLKEHMSTNIHNLAQSQQEVIDRDGTVLLGHGDDASSSDDDEHGVACMQGADQAMEQDAPDAVPFTAHYQGLPVTMQQAPAIDQDGFQTVQKPLRRRAVQTH